MEVREGKRQPNFIDMTGKRFGRLTVLKEAGKSLSNGGITWLCKCDCGKQIVVLGASLRSGNTKSCGCYSADMAREIGKSRNKYSSKNNRIYTIWRNMRQRCTNESKPDYHRYGGRGISICEEWSDFEAFQKWSYANGYKDTLSIDRIDNNGNYTPDNCRWSDLYTQANNKRNNRKYLYEGKNYTANELGRMFNIKPSTFIRRMKLGWSIEEALSIPVKVGNNQNLRRDYLKVG